MTLIKKHGLTLLITACLFGAVLLIANSYAHLAGASAPSGLPATQAIATTTQIGPQADVTLFAANTSCAARVIRTQGQGAHLVFADPTNGDFASTSLSVNLGFYQAASTTVAYDSGLFGCGRMVAYAEASTTITVAEMR